VKVSESDVAPVPEKVRGRSSGRAAIAVLALLALAAASAAGVWWWHSRGIEDTDDAFIAGHVTSVSPQVAGRVLEVLVDDNQKVKTGDVLIKLDTAPFEVLVQQARADLSEAERKLQEAQSQHKASLALAEQARADEASAQAQAKNASTDLLRYSQLVKSGAVSQQAEDNAETLARTTGASLQAAQKKAAATEAQAALAQAQIETARAGVDKARAVLDKQLLDLSYTQVKASVGGFVTRKAVEPGDYIQVGQAVMNLVQDDVWVVANFKETQLKGMKPGQKVDVVVDTYPDHTFLGHVDSIQAGTGAAFSLLPPQNASGNYVKVVQRVPVKIVLDLKPDESGMLLAPGMSVVPRVHLH